MACELCIYMQFQCTTHLQYTCDDLLSLQDHLKRKIEGHVVGYSHLFNNRDYKNHTYLAMPETAVLKDDGTPVDGQDPLLQGYNANN